MSTHYKSVVNLPLSSRCNEVLKQLTSASHHAFYQQHDERPGTAPEVDLVVVGMLAELELLAFALVRELSGEALPWVLL